MTTASQRLLSWLVAMVAMAAAATMVMLACIPGTFQSVAFADEPDLSAGEGALFVQAGDSVDRAELIGLNAWTSNQLSDREDKDWYSIELTQPGRLDIVFSGEYVSEGTWYVSLRNADNDEIWSGSHNATENLAGKTFTLHTTGLPAGTFYIEVYGNYYNSNPVVNKNYRIMPKFAASTAWETELNDTVVTYDPIPLNVAVSGTLSDREGKDWYRITLTQPGRLDILFSGEYVASGTWYVSLRNEDNDELWSGSHDATENLAGKTFTLHTTGLPSGTFYIEVYGNYYNSNPVVGKVYRMMPKFAASTAWETELNDTVVTYDSVPVGSAVYGTLRDREEQDWYRITLPKAGRLQLSFSGEYAPGGTWYISLRNADNQELWSGSYAGELKKNVILANQQLNAGAYYVQVYGNYYNSNPAVNKVYSLTPSYYVSNTAITKLVRGPQAFTVKWAKVSGASKYQLRYSPKSSMKGSKTVTTTKKVHKKQITKLKAKKRYYVQVRVVKTVAGKTYYSAWSAKRPVRTK